MLLVRYIEPLGLLLQRLLLEVHQRLIGVLGVGEQPLHTALGILPIRVQHAVLLVVELPDTGHGGYGLLGVVHQLGLAVSEHVVSTILIALPALLPIGDLPGRKQPLGGGITELLVGGLALKVVGDDLVVGEALHHRVHCLHLYRVGTVVGVLGDHLLHLTGQPIVVALKLGVDALTRGQLHPLHAVGRIARLLLDARHLLVEHPHVGLIVLVVLLEVGLGA